MPENDPHLVAGRSCGECTVCCEVLTIDQPELKKLPGIACTHCKPGGGCAIYETRPPICRNWHCGWRKAETLGPEWRPDRSNILILVTTDDIPAPYRQHGLKFELIGGQHGQIAWPPLVLQIATFIDAGVPVFLSLPGPPGHGASKIFLNSDMEMQEAVASHNFERVANALASALEICVRHEKEKIALE